jgi:hypothetical protein
LLRRQQMEEELEEENATPDKGETFRAVPAGSLESDPEATPPAE